jgi:adenylate cyclase
MQWSIEPVVGWLLHKGRHLPSPERLVAELCSRVRDAGMPIERVGFFFWTLHPQYSGSALFWREGRVERMRGDPDLRTQPVYTQSPVARIVEGTRVIRRRLEQPGCPIDFPVLAEVKAEGMTDWVMVEVVFGSGQRNAVSLATRRPGGFSDHDIAETERILHPFALAMENFTNRELAQTLLETYLGRKTGTRVLQGQIRRGDGEGIDAVIWFSDLRDSTPLAQRLGEARFLGLLNDYFEATAGAVLEHGGEVLRFIGDASLAVFPISDTQPRRDMCAAAVEAARAARGRTASVNERRMSAGEEAFHCGIGLHLGHVLYGNIGTPERLEFSVIGAAANETARIEALCKRTGRDIVVSRAVADALGAEWPGLGRFELAGVDRPIEVLALP